MLSDMFWNLKCLFTIVQIVFIFDTSKSYSNHFEYCACGNVDAIRSIRHLYNPSLHSVPLDRCAVIKNFSTRSESRRDFENNIPCLRRLSGGVCSIHNHNNHNNLKVKPKPDEIETIIQELCKSLDPYL